MTAFSNEPIVTDPSPVAPPEGLVPSGLIQLGTGSYHPNKAIVADKARRTLSVWKNNNGDIQLLAHYAMDHGKKSGDKVKQGDLKTPEGIYFVQDKKYSKELDFNEYGVMAFTLNYPNHFDRMLKKTGSGIWLHSIPPHKTLKRGSRGCLVLRENNIKKIDKHIKLDSRTPILIYDQVEYITKEQLKAQQQKLMAWLSAWKQQWQTKDSNSYISNYSKKFQSKGMNYNQWKLYKKNVSQSTRQIKVQVRQPVIYKNKDQIIVRFLQDYSSDVTNDFGEKTLYLKLENQQPKIVSEIWKQEKKELLGSMSL